jgi:predicted RNase H-like HicB family nuclease
MADNVELVFRVKQESDGGYCAECLSEPIFTQGDTWEELEAMIKDAVNGYFFDDPGSRSIRIELEK